MKKTLRFFTLAVLFVFTTVVLTGCAKKVNFSDLSMGMAKNNIISMMGTKYESMTSPERLVYKGSTFSDLITPPGDTKIVYFFNSKDQMYCTCYYLYGAKAADYESALKVLSEKYGEPNEKEADSALWAENGFTITMMKTDEYVGISMY